MTVTRATLALAMHVRDTYVVLQVLYAAINSSCDILVVTRPHFVNLQSDWCRQDLGARPRNRGVSDQTFPLPPPLNVWLARLYPCIFAHSIIIRSRGSVSGKKINTFCFTSGLISTLSLQRTSFEVQASISKSFLV